MILTSIIIDVILLYLKIKTVYKCCITIIDNLFEYTKIKLKNNKII